MAEKTPDHFISRGGQNVNLKDLIFGGGVKSGGDGGTYRDSIQAWLPIKNIIGGVVITKDVSAGSAQPIWVGKKHPI